MDGGRFHRLAAQAARVQGDRLRGLWRASILGAATTGVAGGRARAQQTPTTVPIRVGPEPTQPPEPPDSIAAPPTPTVPPSGPARVTPTATTAPPTRTPTSVPPTSLPPSPTPVPPTPAAPQEEAQPEEAEQSIFDPFNPFCGPGPFGPWFPVVAPPEVTALSGIRWYGLQPDMTSQSLVAGAFGEGGEELSRGEVSRDISGAYHWSLSDGQARIEASFTVQTDATEGVIVGEVGGQPFTLTVDGGLDMNQPVSLGEAEERLLGSWNAVIPKFEVLYDVFASGGSSAYDPHKCFGSGFVLPIAIISCSATIGLGCAAVSVFGGYIWNNCTD